MTKSSRHSSKHIGADFDDFLGDEGILEESTTVAIKRVIVWQIRREMKAQKISKSKMVAMMGVSRSHLDSLLDESNSRLTLKMLASVSIALQKKLRVELVA
ncbi:Fis family transcriptional regulator [Dyella sp.]|uniref:Fis family transcriptional regulator n=1 Tax=Dyella sp. TaxID=1869338 RepID=UPI002C639E8F|nr:Fis family transcriptional regulator [Dyella sp.]HTC26194.1 Fis family transcriptional regulator [Dyella sp.]